MNVRNLLAINVGSTTLKAAAYTLETAGAGERQLLVERSRAEVPAGGTAQRGLDALLGALSEHAHAPDAIVHRIVHGGDRTRGAELNEALLAELDALAPLAPLHQAAALAFARAARQRWPQSRHGAAFDTSFHASLAPWSRRLPVPAEWDELGVRRYGFHGIAFASALRKVADQEPGILQGRAVFAHLGGGCSLCAVHRGTSLDTTMALTPLGGVPSPARPGDLDPGLLLYVLRHTGLDTGAMEAVLSHKAGLVGIAGHDDMRKLLADTGKSAKLAIELFSMRIAQSVAALATTMGGLDHLVFSGGIGHRAPVLRARIVAHLTWLGLLLDARANDAGALRFDHGAGVALWNVPIDEERELAESVLFWL